MQEVVEQVIEDGRVDEATINDAFHDLENLILVTKIKVRVAQKSTKTKIIVLVGEGNKTIGEGGHGCDEKRDASRAIGKIKKTCGGTPLVTVPGKQDTATQTPRNHPTALGPRVYSSPSGSALGVSYLRKLVRVHPQTRLLEHGSQERRELL